MTSTKKEKLFVPPLLVMLALLCAPTKTAAARRRNPWRFSLRGEAQFRYDDNILSLSQREKNLLDVPSVKNSDRFRINTVDDVIQIASLSVNINRSPRHGRDTAILLTAQAYDYSRNSVKDYQQYGLMFRQELNRSHDYRTVLTIGGSHIPSYYLRQLIDDDASQLAGTTIRNALEYEKNRGYVKISQEVLPSRLVIAASYALERRNYTSDFDERDSSSDLSAVEVRIYPLGRNNWRIRPYFEHENRDARSDLASTSVVDDDVGFDSDLFGVDVRLLWGPDREHRQRVRGFYQKEQRDFTTSLSQDLGHFRRDDDIDKYGLDYSIKFGPTWSAAFSTYRRENDVSTPSRGTTTFTRNVVAGSLIYRFSHRFGRSGR